MIASAKLIEWFRDEPLPNVLPDPVVVVGGTGLLAEFISVAARSGDGGQLSIAAPYVRAGVAAALPAWSQMRHDRIDLVLVTASMAEARRAATELQDFPWRSVAAGVRPRLHAKLYSFVDVSGAGACLVGSHNLSRGGARDNHEAGVLFAGTSDPDINWIVRACAHRVERLLHESNRHIDSLRWPAERAA